MDALGRLIRVTENPGLDDLAYRTNYQFDALDNLTLVCHASLKSDGTCPGTAQSRSFFYDFLSRLKSATNPESGTITYEYDSNGNLVKKTDSKNVTCFGNSSGGTCNSSDPMVTTG